MSNSIWKMPDQKPDVFKPHTIMVVYEAHDEAELMLSTQYEAYTADRYINRWCYLDELLAQADKAERLQKENEAMREEFEVWHGNHKCVVEDLEIATKALGKYADEDMWETGHRWEVDYIQALFLEHGYKIAKEALKEINRKED